MRVKKGSSPRPNDLRQRILLEKREFESLLNDLCSPLYPFGLFDEVETELLIEMTGCKESFESPEIDLPVSSFLAEGDGFLH